MMRESRKKSALINCNGSCGGEAILRFSRTVSFPIARAIVIFCGFDGGSWVGNSIRIIVPNYRLFNR